MTFGCFAQKVIPRYCRFRRGYAHARRDGESDGRRETSLFSLYPWVEGSDIAGVGVRHRRFTHGSGRSSKCLTTGYLLVLDDLLRCRVPRLCSLRHVIYEHIEKVDALIRRQGNFLQLAESVGIQRNQFDVVTDGDLVDVLQVH